MRLKVEQPLSREYSHAMTEIRHPIAHAIPYQDPLLYFLHLNKFEDVVFLDSAKQGKYSYIAFDPFDQLIYHETDLLEENIFTILEHKLAQFKLQPLPELPPFQGGAAGFLSYDLARDIESLPDGAVDDMQYPRLALGFYDVLLSFDHVQQKAWVVSSGVQAQIRLDDVLKILQSNKKVSSSCIQAPLIPNDKIKSNFTQQAYMNAVSKIVRYIEEGDIFEANLTQRFKCCLPDDITPIDLYKRVRHFNPAPFASYVKFENTTIVSSSPERFLQLQQGHIETRPIKGTVRRSEDINEDRSLAEQLVHSEKDRAENTMIVDLMRNDLSRICLPHTVKVPQYCGLESYQTVHHLVSVVEGQLDNQYGVIDVLRATFPGGSITGAPKVRAMEIIDELEPTRRGPYCGSVGYIGFDGCMDLSILIRTFIIKNQTVTFQGGGAVVLDSDPTAEYEEALVKVAALRRALTDPIEIEEIVS